MDTVQGRKVSRSFLSQRPADGPVLAGSTSLWPWFVLLLCSKYQPSSHLSNYKKTIKHNLSRQDHQPGENLNVIRTPGRGLVEQDGQGLWGRFGKLGQGCYLQATLFQHVFFSTCIKILSQIQQVIPNFHKILSLVSYLVECRRAIIGAKREDLRVLWEATEDR